VTADHSPERLSAEDRAGLAAAIHARNEFDHDQCDHGTYTGGHMHGQPYAMCERAASEHSIVTATVERILAAHLADVEARLAAVEGYRDILSRSDREYRRMHARSPKIAIATVVDRLDAALHPAPSEQPAQGES
jgi:hypothetical protein